MAAAAAIACHHITADLGLDLHHPATTGRWMRGSAMASSTPI